MGSGRGDADGALIWAGPNVAQTKLAGPRFV
jgi:hypothetical protein